MTNLFNSEQKIGFKKVWLLGKRTKSNKRKHKGMTQGKHKGWAKGKRTAWEKKHK